MNGVALTALCLVKRPVKYIARTPSKNVISYTVVSSARGRRFLTARMVRVVKKYKYLFLVV